MGKVTYGRRYFGNLIELQQAYSELHLEEEVFLQRGRNGADHILHTDEPEQNSYLKRIIWTNKNESEEQNQQIRQRFSARIKSKSSWMGQHNL